MMAKFIMHYAVFVALKHAGKMADTKKAGTATPKV